MPFQPVTTNPSEQPKSPQRRWEQKGRFSSSLPLLHEANRAPSGRFPPHLRRSLPRHGDPSSTTSILSKKALPTVCQEARCPNLPKCFAKKTATFLTLGPKCTRHCGFCSIETDRAPALPDPLEGEKIAAAAKQLGLRHIVLTMVARDDLPLDGSVELKKIVQTLTRELPDATLELLTSDFQGKEEALDLLLEEPLAVFNHNVETVERLTSSVRHQATYARSLDLLRYIKRHQRKGMKLKSGLMLGLGEEQEEVYRTLRDLREVGCDIVTIGQYLQPTKKHLRVKQFISQAQFDAYSDYGTRLGIAHMYCGPFVRSSYNADLFV